MVPPPKVEPPNKLPVVPVEAPNPVVPKPVDLFPNKPPDVPPKSPVFDVAPKPVVPVLNVNPGLDVAPNKPPPVDVALPKPPVVPNPVLDPIDGLLAENRPVPCMLKKVFF